MKVLDPQSALLTNAEVYQFLKINPPTPAEKKSGSYPLTNLNGYNAVKQDFLRYTTEITPFVTQHAPAETWLSILVKRLKPYELTKTEVLNLINVGVGARTATTGTQQDGEEAEEVDEETLTSRDVAFFRVAVEEAEERFAGDEGEARILEVVGIMREVLQGKLTGDVNGEDKRQAEDGNAQANG